MRQINRFCAGLALMLAFALPTFAGHMPCGIDDPPPPPPEQVTAADTSDDVLEFAVSLLQGVLSAF